jgi:beta-mannanase
MATPEATTWEWIGLAGDLFAAVISRLAAARTTRRQAAAGLFASAATLPQATEAKRKRKKKHARRKQESDGGQGRVALGAYVPKALDDPDILKAFTKSIGRDLDYLVWYEDWANGNFGDDQRAYLRTFDEANLTPVISWNPFDADGPKVDQPAYRLSKILNGNFNGYIDGWANGLAAYGNPVFLNFAHEMNGNWVPWGVDVNGNQTGDFVKVWRQIHDRFNAKGARNVRWVWMPNVTFRGAPASLDDVYPGDNYVDWIGMDGYNWGTSVYWESCPCQSSWQTFGDVFDKTYNKLLDLTDKPIMIGETASSEEGGNKAHWIKDALQQQLPEAYPQIRAFTWFNKKATGLDTNQHGEVVHTAKVDWRVESSSASLDAFSSAVNSSYFDGKLKAIG